MSIGFFLSPSGELEGGLGELEGGFGEAEGGFWGFSEAHFGTD